MVKCVTPLAEEEGEEEEDRLSSPRHRTYGDVSIFPDARRKHSWSRKWLNPRRARISACESCNTMP